MDLQYLKGKQNTIRQRITIVNLFDYRANAKFGCSSHSTIITTDGHRRRGHGGDGIVLLLLLFLVDIKVERFDGKLASSSFSLTAGVLGT